jgi:hypothetical protein
LSKLTVRRSSVPTASASGGSCHNARPTRRFFRLDQFAELVVVFQRRISQDSSDFFCLALYVIATLQKLSLSKP